MFDNLLTYYIETLPGSDGAAPREHEIPKENGGSPLDNTVAYQVPAGRYFVLGDNRDNSLDSRSMPSGRGIGFVPAANLLGRIEAIYWPPSRIGRVH